jgi:hypothetical protein
MSSERFGFSFNLNHLNNAKLNGVNAMPAKDLTSDSDNSFALDRKAYMNYIATENTHPEKYLNKKWIGGNRDASDVAYRRRIAAMGSSLNPDKGSFSFTSKTEQNTRIEALNRCRNKGNCVPKKVRASPHCTNVPTPIWKKPNLVRSKFHAVLTKETPMVHKQINTVNGYS